ncbi:hypothetical protein AC579_5013 [Pseudocercospora musae]|uniref:Uncharacterized protein n=1 Tax=Pseudocercospora musae TaxID=113226 RepID=A0A139I8B7_9PEZI|nr:hypothetical protein AC579_5013 [Pseudocercospora musae]
MAHLIILPLLAAAATASLDTVIYGGGVAAGVLAQSLKGQALDLVNEEASEAIDRATWYPEQSSVIVMGTGTDAGKVILDYEKLPNTTHRPDVAVVDPAPFMMQLLNGTDESRLHPNMTLVDIKHDSEGSPLELTFIDGSRVSADVLIADGGLLSPFMNFLSAVGHAPPKEAHRLLGSPYADERVQHR